MTDFVDFLRWSNQGSELFLRTVDAMTDDDFSRASLLPNWSTAKVIAHVAFNAQAINNLVHWALSGVETPMYRSASERAEQIERSDEMSTADIRDLVKRADRDLAEHFGELDDSTTTRMVVTAQGRNVPASELPWMRAREVWVHAVDLDQGVGFSDFPEEFIDDLLDNMVAQRHPRANHPSLTLIPANRDRIWNIGEKGETTITVRGGASDIARWLAGRGEHGVMSDSGTLPEIGPWF